MNIESLRHEKEKTYGTIMMVVGCIVWIGIIVGTLGLVFLYLGLLAIVTWLASHYFKASIYGNSIKVTAKQYPELHRILVEQSQRMGLQQPPEMFIYAGEGIINAVAVRFMSTRYVILMSNLVDLMLKRRKLAELGFVIGHELGHHAAGHTDVLRNLLMAPGRFIPFLGAAYSRSCELTCDRIGSVAIGDPWTAQNALVAIALGSESLSNQTDIGEFIAQEIQVPELMGFIHKIYSNYPRMTRRVIEVNNFHHRSPGFIAG